MKIPVRGPKGFLQKSLLRIFIEKPAENTSEEFFCEIHRRFS